MTGSPARRSGGRARARGGLAAVYGALGVLLAAAAVAVALTLLLYFGPGPALPHGHPATIVLRNGAGLQEIASDLKRAGVISSDAVFIAAAEVTGAAHRLKAGEYAFP